MANETCKGENKEKSNPEEKLPEKLRKYREITGEALAKIGVKAKKGEEHEKAIGFIKMARDYFNDAKYFEDKEMPLTALAAYSYAHAWLDAGIKAGYLDGKKDDRLFVL